jgi:two-component system CheB/CheR fusion protein
VQHPPISRIDLLVCRNTLMYFTSEMQARVLANFHFALAEHGYLFLGKSEATISRSSRFEVVNLRQRVFRRVSPGDLRAALAEPGTRRLPTPRVDHADAASAVKSVFEESPIAQIVVDRGGTVTAVNRRARALFGLPLDSAGRALKDLQVSYRPIDLRPVIDEVIANRRPVAVHDVEWTTPSGETEYLDVALLPVNLDGSGGVAVTYMQIGRYKVLQDELERSQHDLENAYEELQSTVEELETTNEELQSTNEELETTNEELHSANEELETMNEELQSTNEELETANNELRDRGLALDEVNGFLESILGSLRSAVVVLNRDMAVRAWNREAENMWGLRADEVEGSHFLNLDIGLAVDQLRGAIRACMTGSSEGEELSMAAVNRRGRPIICTVDISPLREAGSVIGVILVMEGAPPP